MIEELQKWPSPVSQKDLSGLSLETLLAHPEVRSNLTTLEQFKYLRNITLALTSIRASDYIGLGFIHDADTLLGHWAGILTNIRNEAENNPELIRNGTFTYEDHQYGFGIVYSGPDPELSGDPVILGSTSELRKDFGKLFDIGKSILAYQTAAKFGVNSTLTKASQESITKLTSQALEDVTTTTNNEISRAVTAINSAAAIKSWSGHYEDRIIQLERGIQGYKKSSDQKWSSIKKTIWGLQWKRTAWFVALLMALLAYMGVALILVFKVDHWAIDSLSGFGRSFLGITVYGFLGGIFIGYSHANKQLKVNQNILEQYKHRAIAAKTIEEMISAVAKTKKGELSAEESESVIEDDQLRQLIAVASNAMFEYRPIGHLSTKENSSMLSEIYNVLRS